MAIKAGNIVHVGNETVVIDRIQTAGPGNLNIPTEKIYELGNYQSVATIRDVPDLTFTMDSYDMSTEIEALLTNSYTGRTVTDGVTATSVVLTSATAAFTADDVGRMVIVEGAGGGSNNQLVTTIAVVNSGTSVDMADAATTTDTALTVKIVENGIDLATCVPLDIASQFKPGISNTTPYDVISSVAIPFLYMESMSYRFGLRDNAQQSVSLKGDSIFYNPGATFVEETVGSGSGGQAVATTYPAYEYTGDGGSRRVLAVTVGSKRLVQNTDYTEAYGSVTNGAAVSTVTITDAVAVTDTIRVIYSSPQTKSYAQNVHALTTVKPAAVRGKDIYVYVGGYDPNDEATSAANKWGSVQSVNADWRATLEKDEEFGNYYAVGQDFDVPEVNGSCDIKPQDPDDLLTKIREASGISDPYAVLGAQSSTPLELDIVVKDPDTSNTVKRFHIPDARFTLPGYSGRIQTKLTVTMNFESDSGVLQVFEA
jgi:hypothetical protein